MAIIMSHQSAAKHIVNMGVRAGLTTLFWGTLLSISAQYLSVNCVMI